MSMTVHIAFVGLGNMGGVILQRLALQRDLDLRCQDARPGLARSFEGAGVTAAETLAAAASGADIIFTCLPKPSVIDAVYLGTGGLAEIVQPGAVCVDLSTNHPHLAKRIGAELAGRGISFVDAPVAGGVERAKEGRLTVMAGGAESNVDRVEPLLARFAARVFRTGPNGTGCLAKVINNQVALCNMLNMTEALTLAAASGIKPAFMDQIIASASGQSTAQVHLASKLAARDWSPSFSLDLALKDIRIALDVAKSHDVRLKMAEVLEERYAECVERGWGSLDMAAMAKLDEELLFK